MAYNKPVFCAKLLMLWSGQVYSYMVLYHSALTESHPEKTRLMFRFKELFKSN